jgi:hypothetical protein
MSLTKIKEYTIMKAGSATSVIAIPKVWMSDNKIKLHDKIEMFRSNIDGKDVLVIAKKKGK